MDKEEVLFKLGDSIIAGKNNLHRNLYLECDKIYLTHTFADISIEVTSERIDKWEYIIINGVKFKRDKSE